MPTSTIPSKSLLVVSPSSSSASANIESPVVPREWSVSGYHSYLKAVQSQLAFSASTLPIAPSLAANSDSIATTADSQAACIRIIRRM